MILLQDVQRAVSAVNYRLCQVKIHFASLLTIFDYLYLADFPHCLGRGQKVCRGGLGMASLGCNIGSHGSLGCIIESPDNNQSHPGHLGSPWFKIESLGYKLGDCLCLELFPGAHNKFI